MEVLLSKVEARKNVLFGTLSSGISNKRKTSGWESVFEAVNAVGSEKRTQAEVKKKCSDIKVDVKRRMAAHRQKCGQNRRGDRREGPTLFEQRVGAIMVDTALSGVVGAHVGDSDYPQGKYLCICVTHNKLVHTVT